jgi:hypothetical protein
MRSLTCARWSTERFHADSRLDQGPGEPPVRGDLLIAEEFDRHAA